MADRAMTSKETDARIIVDRLLRGAGWDIEDKNQVTTEESIKDGLDIALKKLQHDKATGFGDVLRILDFLLAFRYQEFETAELDAIETFVCSTKEHTFQIKERINAIRVRKILNKPSISVRNDKQIESLKVETV